MLKIKINGTTDAFERLLLNLVEDWDELERWMLRYGSDANKVTLAAEEKEKLLAKIQEIRRAESEGN